MTWEGLAIVVGIPVAFIIGFVAFLRSCYALDEILPEVFTNVASRVLEPSAKTRAAISFFLTCFDKLFWSSSKQRPLFWRCAGFSCLVYLAVLCSWAVLLTDFTKPISFLVALAYPLEVAHMHLIKKSILSNLGVVFCLLLSVNVVGDYFSLWETRWILNKLKANRSIFCAAILWFFDILATLAIYVVSLTFGVILVKVFSVIVQWPMHLMIYKNAADFWTFITFTFGLTTMLLPLTPGFNILSIFGFLTTFSTTLWAVMAIIAMNTWSFLRLARFLPRPDERPFGALTVAATALLFLLLVVLVIVT